jgi:FkbM family methyltransferase
MIPLPPGWGVKEAKTRVLKTVIRGVLGHAGYEVRRLRDGAQPRREYPFVSQVTLGGVEFSFWVKDVTAERWYAPEEQGKLVENQILADLVAPGDRVLEVGCHQGFYLAFLSKLVGPNGFVLGVDINPENVMIAQAQLVLNRVTGHCEVLHRAASASVQAELGYSDSTNSMVVLSGEERRGTVKGTRVDDLCANYGDFDVLMVDVEGFEEEVLKGASALLDRRKPKLAVEIHSDNLLRYGSTLRSLALAGRFSHCTGRMVLRSVDRNKSLPFQLEALPSKGISNVFLTRLS